MVIISDLSDDLLLKILSFLPTKVAVSTSLLSKRWMFLWMWLPKLEYNDYEISGPLSPWLRYQEFIDKNLPLHRAPVIESLLLRFHPRRLSQPEKIKIWVGIAVSRFVRELSIESIDGINRKLHDVASLPSSLYTCNSLMTLKLEGKTILVDVPRIVCLPCLKTLKLERVTYSNEDSLGLLLSHCPVLEDLLIERDDDEDDNVRALVVNVPSLQRLSLEIDRECSSDGYVIVTPCLKYLKIVDYRDITSYLIEPMPELQEADIEDMKGIQKILESITSVRRLSLHSSSLYRTEEEVTLFPPRIDYFDYFDYFDRMPRDLSSLPSSLNTCNSLMTLKLQGNNILVGVPPTVCLPSLKTLQLQRVAFLNEDSLRLLLSHCPVLEDLLITRDDEDDNVRTIVVNVPSLQRLSLEIDSECSSDEYVIVTPCLKYLKIMDYRGFPSYLIEPMPKLEEADIDVSRDIQKILESITSVRRLSLRSWFRSAEEPVYRAGVVFNQLEHVKLRVYKNDWSKLLIWLLGNSPKLRVLNLCVDRYQRYKEYQPVNWKNTGSSVPECLLRSLETFEFKNYTETQEERDFLSFFFKHARCLKSTSVQSLGMQHN